MPQRTPEQDAAEQEKNKNWDPNASLYGKNPAKPASAAEAVVKPAEGNPPENKPAASADPLGDLVKARANFKDIDRCWEAVKHARSDRKSVV